MASHLIRNRGKSIFRIKHPIRATLWTRLSSKDLVPTTSHPPWCQLPSRPTPHIQHHGHTCSFTQAFSVSSSLEDSGCTECLREGVFFFSPSFSLLRLHNETTAEGIGFFSLAVCSIKVLFKESNVLYGVRVFMFIPRNEYHFMDAEALFMFLALPFSMSSYIYFQTPSSSRYQIITSTEWEDFCI